ncbi:MAG TPA: hypothetical protein VK203_26610 [Nostocaceae cyanobacterium]|nr:hypothetical protein [Nostocaceae cyanobacterium]
MSNQNVFAAILAGSVLVNLGLMQSANATPTTFNLDGSVTEFNYKIPTGDPPIPEFAVNSPFTGSYTLNASPLSPDNCFIANPCFGINQFSFTFGNRIFDNIAYPNAFGQGDTTGAFLLSLNALIADPQSGGVEKIGQLTISRGYLNNNLKKINFSATGAVCIEINNGQFECDNDPVGESWFGGNVTLEDSRSIPESSVTLGLGVFGLTAWMLRKKIGLKIS